MAWTNVGFDGTINEAQWSQMAGLLGNDYVAAGNGDCLVTAVGGARSVSVAAGSLYGDGIVSTNSGAETVAMTTPVNGQWYVIALRRTWATNTAALVAIAGATTTTTTPTAPPTSFPTLNTNKGVLTDQPIAWAWCNSANTTVVVYDIRLKAVKSLPPVVANQNERDAKFMTPTQGLQVWRDDLGAVETYFTAYNSSTNPGGRDSAGWYVTNRSAGFVTMRPTSSVIVSGSGAYNAMGTLNFSSATSVSLNGIFNSSFSNYKVIFTGQNSSGGANFVMRLRASGTDLTTAGYQSVSMRSRSDNSTVINAGASTDSFILSGGSSSSDDFAGEMTIYRPALTARTYASGQHSIRETEILSYIMTTGGHTRNINQYDGITFAPTAGTITGSITVYGII